MNGAFIAKLNIALLLRHPVVLPMSLNTKTQIKITSNDIELTVH